ncbi:hypothetical protein BJ138DRAFT_524066 [Hygrophoropsis aurantiaca]|uniref:Uncharacterized protein n=1 Tax=Hygrophoropsis aurantiaca TaxID=72124 RepID=A0ACB8A3J1_9AGAM|nr:hypothetical protein BJ138DRAFT_524066 [Hygrophoropsis aurantiaca]
MKEKWHKCERHLGKSGYNRKQFSTVEFQIWSSDQGSAHDVPNHATYTHTTGPTQLSKLPMSIGFRLILFPVSAAPEDRCCTEMSMQVFHHHAVTWHYLDSVHPESAESVEADLKGRGLGGTFIRRLKAGDYDTLRMRSGIDYHSWGCIAEQAIIDVYWAVCEL